MVPWIAAQPGGATISEVCERFAITPAQLREDLSTMQFVGPAPQTPDMLVDVSITDEWIDIGAQWFDRPPALTIDQALVLIAAGRALLNVPGSDPDSPLARATARVEAAIGLDPDAINVDLGPADHDIYEVLHQAAIDGTPVAIRYYSHGRDDTTDRVIEPWQVVADQGAWYVEGWCQHAGERRVFRLDRISAAERHTGAATMPRQPQFHPGGTLDEPDDEDLAVTLVVDRSLEWAIERWQADSVEPLDESRTRVTLRVHSPQWLERLLLQLGQRATVESCSNPDALDVAGAAQRIIDRYRP